MAADFVTFTREQVDKINAKLDSIAVGVVELTDAMHDMKNDLCALCGRYRMAHEGACDDCRWRNV